MNLPAKYRRSRVIDDEIEYHHDECQGGSAKLFVKYCNHNGKLGWVFHCFSCEGLPGGLVGFCPDTSKLSPADAIRMYDMNFKKRDRRALVHHDTVDLPEDFGELNQQCMHYLLKYDITPEEIQDNNIGYSAIWDRLIIPVYDKDKRLVMWQGRYFGDNPKETKHTTVVADNNREGIFYRPAGNVTKTGSVVLVESALSAIKVSRVCNAIALLGSSLPKQSQTVFATHLGAYHATYVWLDPDKWAASVKLVDRLRSIYDVNAYSLLTGRKPKCYTDTSVVEILKGKRFVE